VTKLNSTSSYLLHVRQAGDRLLLGVMGALLFLSFVLAPWYDTWTAVLVIGLPTMAIVSWIALANSGTLVARCAVSAGLMVFTALQIHQAHGMVEMHFGVFVLLAFVLFYRDWVPLVVAGGLIAVHHVAVFLLQHGGSPVYLFSAESGFGIVLVHAAYVVFETALLAWIAVRLRAEIEAVGCEPLALARVSQELARGNVAVEVPTAGAARESLAFAMSSMRDELQRTVQGTADVLHAISGGDLSRRVETQSAGEFARLNDRVNKTVDFLSTFSQQQHHLIQRANAGDFSVRCDTQGLAGFQLSLATGLNQLVMSMDAFIGQFAEALGSVASGDLTKQISQTYQGRFEDLKRETNATAEQLAMIVGRIRVSADTIQTNSHELARTNADLSARTEQQSEALTSTALSVEELTTVVRQSAENANLANELSDAASKTASKGGEVVAHVVSTMEGISESSNKISDIIGVIQDIAFQTNLLALNAAVEAARAGEQGRGFAVVATEVRGLAGRTATAAKEIKALISASVKQVETGNRLVEQAGATMDEIVRSTANVSDVVRRIATATREQSTGIDAVSRTISQVKTVTEKNAGAVEEAAAAAERMANEARALGESVQVFKMRGDDGRSIAARAAA